jgi:predicted dehydrogenase
VRRIALVGAGYISQIHAEALRGLPGLRIAAIVDPNLDAARRLADACGAARVHDSVTAALAEGGIDAAHVLVPPGVHREATLPFLAAGKPVLVEKPLAASADECGELLDAAAASGTVLGVNQNFVFHPAFLRLRRLLEQGRFGRPNLIDSV